MKELGRFEIGLRGLRDGIHNFKFEVDQKFFACFEEALIGPCRIEVKVSLDRRPSLLVLQIDHEGTMKADCDRCAEEIDLPLSGSRRILVKFSEEALEEEDDVIYLEPDAERLILGPLIYDLISLSVPMVKKYDCENDASAPCNQEVLKYLTEHQTEEEQKDDSVWDALKNLKL